MNYKQAALDHVRSVCLELTETATTQNYDEVDWVQHTPHLEHWLRGISDKLGSQGGTAVRTDVTGSNIAVYGTKFDFPEKVLPLDLTKNGENQSEDFYKAYCEIAGINPN